MTQPFIETAAGGALFGAAAGLLLLAHGRIAGIAGIAAGMLRPKQGELVWRALFVLGLLAGGLVAAALVPSSFTWHRDASAARLIAAGLLIGIGSRVGNGCTSGHGVCGVARLSLRSMVAVMLFSATGALTHAVDVLVKGRSL